MNKVFLLGRMTADAEAKSVGSAGNKVANFTIAVDKRGKDAGADFIRCVAWNKTAEIIADYYKKGRQICLLGSLSIGSYPVEKDGVSFSQNTAEVQVSELFFFNDGRAGGQNTSAQARNENAPVAEKVPYVPSAANLEQLDSMDAIPSLF